MEVYLSLGSNLGDRKGNIFGALERLDRAFGVHYADVSGLLETEPWGFESDEMFLNAVVRYDLPWGPDAGAGEMDAAGFASGILDKCKAVEREMGRQDAAQYDAAGERIYHSRIIDVDILFCGSMRIDSQRLNVPHRKMKERDFVMIPLKEIATEYIKGVFPEIFIGK